MADLKGWLDHPFVFLFAITIGVYALGGVIAWIFYELGWTGPLGLMKGGVKG